MGMSFENNVHVESNCLDDLINFLNENDVKSSIHNGGILFDVDEESKVLIKRENGVLRPILVPGDLETTGLILSILLERSKPGNHIIFGYLTTFLGNAGVNAVWNKEENAFKVYESDCVWYIIGCGDESVSVSKYWTG